MVAFFSTWCVGGTGIFSARPFSASSRVGIFSFLSNMHLPHRNDTVSAHSMLKNWLRAARAVNARAIGATVAALPSLEPAFIGIGRWVGPGPPGFRGGPGGARGFPGGVFGFGEEDLLPRLRRPGRRYRVLPIAGIEFAVDV